MAHLQILLDWCKRRTRGYDDVEVKDFGKSWRDGLAFCAILHEQRVISVWDFAELEKQNAEGNLSFAFDVAAKAGIPRLLSVEEMLHEPDPDRVAQYLAEWYFAFKTRSGTLRDSLTNMEEDPRKNWQQQQQQQQQAPVPSHKSGGGSGIGGSSSGARAVPQPTTRSPLPSPRMPHAAPLPRSSQPLSSSHSRGSADSNSPLSASASGSLSSSPSPHDGGAPRPQPAPSPRFGRNAPTPSSLSGSSANLSTSVDDVSETPLSSSASSSPRPVKKLPAVPPKRSAPVPGGSAPSKPAPSPAPPLLRVSVASPPSSPMVKKNPESPRGEPPKKPDSPRGEPPKKPDSPRGEPPKKPDSPRGEPPKKPESPRISELLADEGDRVLLTGPKRASVAAKRRPPNKASLQVKSVSVDSDEGSDTDKEASGSEEQDEEEEDNGAKALPAKPASPRPFGASGFAVKLDDILTAKKNAKVTGKMAVTIPSKAPPPQTAVTPAPAPSAPKAASIPTKASSPLPAKKLPAKKVVPAAAPVVVVAKKPLCVQYGLQAVVVEVEENATVKGLTNALESAGFEDPGDFYLMGSNWSITLLDLQVPIFEQMKDSNAKLCCVLDDDFDGIEARAESMKVRFTVPTDSEPKKRVLMVQVEAEEAKVLLTSADTSFSLLGKVLRKLKLPETQPGSLLLCQDGERDYYFQRDEVMWFEMEARGFDTCSVKFLPCFDEVVAAEVLSLYTGERIPLDYGADETADQVLDQLGAPSDSQLILVSPDYPDVRLQPEENVFANVCWFQLDSCQIAFGPFVAPKVDDVAPLDDPFD